MSAPACACDSASRASSSSVASLSTSPSRENTAVAVVGVLAHADVGDHDELGHLALERAHRLLHRRPRRPTRSSRSRPCARECRTAARRRRRASRPRVGIAQQLVDRRLIHARHRIDRRGEPVPDAHEQRQHELRRREPRLAHEVPERGRSAQPARAILGKCWTLLLWLRGRNLRQLAELRRGARAAARADLGRESLAGRLGIARRRARRDPRTMRLPLTSASIPYECRAAARVGDQRADRHLAPAFQRGQKRALGARGDRGGHRDRAVRGGSRILASSLRRLHRDRALTGGGEPRRRVEITGDALFAPRAGCSPAAARIAACTWPSSTF